MIIAFHPRGWDDYLFWQQTDRQMLRRINRLIEDMLRHSFEGIGKPEPLRHELAGRWSRRIDEEHRLVYQVVREQLVILQCRLHY